MALTVIAEHLAPPPPGQPRTYAVHTRTEIRMPRQQFLHTSTALVRLTTLEAAPTGYLLELATLELRPDAPTPPVALLTDIARTNSPLLVRTDAHGALQRVTNKAALAAQWQQLQPWLAAKYRDQPGAAALLAHVGAQYQEESDHLEQALAHKGPCAVLLPGFFGLHSWQGDARTDVRTVHQALGQTALPLHVAWTADPAPDVFAPTVEVHGLGRLDRARFDESAAQDFLETLRGGVWTGPPAPLQVFWREQYTVGRLGQGLLAGRQALRVAVDKLYFADLSHTVRPATSLPAA
jgi:hypothetical protein